MAILIQACYASGRTILMTEQTADLQQPTLKGTIIYLQCAFVAVSGFQGVDRVDPQPALNMVRQSLIPLSAVFCAHVELFLQGWQVSF